MLSEDILERLRFHKQWEYAEDGVKLSLMKPEWEAAELKSRFPTPKRMELLMNHQCRLEQALQDYNLKSKIFFVILFQK